MLPERFIVKHLEYVNPELRDIVLEIRNIVASVAPDATESQHSRGYSYYHKELGGPHRNRAGGPHPKRAGGPHRNRAGGPVSAGICQIGIFPDHVRLGFIHGAFLPDPENRLVGEPKYKKHLRIYHYEDAPWEYVRRLIEASSRFDPYTLKERSGDNL